MLEYQCLNTRNILQESFEEGKTVILTLKDKEVLDEGNDLLVNVNMIDNERYKRSILNKTKKSTYDPYADENFDEYGFSKSTVLDKYDEEIDGEKKDNFVLGTNNAMDVKRRQVEIVKQRLANKKLESLQIAEPKLASEYYNEEELAKFKKPKKKVENRLVQFGVLCICAQFYFLRNIYSRFAICI